ncbi:hypothetical protein [Streptomyces sp. NPDC101115]|uniref:hypothetical protein n=1 Tax=Streptomyces sp. NPDC101115 TaxID=3366106 RepID=UPI003828EA25
MPDTAPDTASPRPRRRTAVVSAVLVLAALGGLIAWRVTGAPEPVPDAGPPTVAEPFRGSPAASWADGAAGIELPQAEAVGGMSKNQVAVALDRVKEFLVAANVEPGMLRGEQSLLASHLLDGRDGVREGVRSWLERPDFEQRNPLWLFTRFDPAESRLIGPVKIRGAMTFEAGDEPGVVRIRAVYAFVYPLADAVPGRDRATRAIVRRDVTFEVDDTDPGALTPAEYQYVVFNHDCGAFDGVVHPWFGGEGTTPGRGADPYALDREVRDLPVDCAPVSRI